MFSCRVTADSKVRAISRASAASWWQGSGPALRWLPYIVTALSPVVAEGDHGRRNALPTSATKASTGSPPPSWLVERDNDVEQPQLSRATKDVFTK